jgi:hypothetical protein
MSKKSTPGLQSSSALVAIWNFILHTNILFLVSKAPQYSGSKAMKLLDTKTESKSSQVKFLIPITQRAASACKQKLCVCVLGVQRTSGPIRIRLPFLSFFLVAAPPLKKKNETISKK